MSSGFNVNSAGGKILFGIFGIFFLSILIRVIIKSRKDWNQDGES